MSRVGPTFEQRCFAHKELQSAELLLTLELKNYNIKFYFVVYIEAIIANLWQILENCLNFIVSHLLILKLVLRLKNCAYHNILMSTKEICAKDF